METRKRSPLLARYISIFERDPKSRVFAPLAESYRKLGMYDEALSVLKKGLSYHPRDIHGHTILANTYYDTQKFEESYKILKPISKTNLDNYQLQKIFALSCYELFYNDEALEVFKNILVINPDDQTARSYVDKLEANASSKPIAEVPAIDNDSDEDEWQQVDLSPYEPVVQISETLSLSESLKAQQDMDFQEVNINSSEILKVKEEAEEETELEDITTAVFNDGEAEPLMTHTLVDLYCNQGLYDRAEEILLKILELKPNDKATHDKLAEVRSSNDEDSGHNDLMAAYDKKFSTVDIEIPVKVPESVTLPSQSKKQRIEKLFMAYLRELKQQAKNYEQTSSNYKRA